MSGQLTDPNGQNVGIGWILVDPDMRRYYNSVDDQYLVLHPATAGSIGIDLCADHDTKIAPGERHTFNSGLKLYVKSDNIAAFIYSRSGLGADRGLVIAQGVGVIDRDYTGPLLLKMLNNSQQTISVLKGDRIAQLVFHQIAIPRLYETVPQNFPHTDRGENGFGSTGR